MAIKHAFVSQKPQGSDPGKVSRDEWNASHIIEEDTLLTANLVQKGPYVDVRAFGAVGDGIANDTAAIQAAIDTGKPVYIPA